MTKKQKNRIAIGIILLLIVGVFLVSSGTLKLPLAITGTSTLSLTQANLQSSNPFLDGKVWLLTFRAGSLAQRYFGTFSPSVIQSATSDSTTTTRDFSVEVNYDDQQCSYSITGTTSRKPIYDIESIKTWSCFFPPDEQKAREKSGLSNILFFGKYLGLECFAIGYNTRSLVGNLNSPDIESEFEITINAAGQTASKRINTLSGTTQGSIGNFAYAVWQGNLVSGKSCPDKDPFVPIYVNGNWRIGNTDAYNEYRSLVSISPSPNRDEQDIWMSNLRNSITRAKQIRSFGTINSRTSLSNAVVKITLQDPVQFPVTTLYIKADTIGIFTPTPEIRLFNPDSECFKTGETGGITVGLENIGEEAGTWNLFAECPSPFISTRNIQVSLQKDEITTRVIPISGTTDKEEERGTCTVFAESPAGTKSKTIGVCVKPRITCDAGQKFCSVSGINEVIKQCSIDGATFSVVETCLPGYFCEDTKCISGDRLDERDVFQKIGDFFRDLFSGGIGFFEIIGLIIAGIALIFGTLFGKQFISSFKAVKGKEGLAWTLALIVGGLLAWLTLVLKFWIGLTVFALWVIFKLIKTNVAGGRIIKRIKKFRK